MRKNDKLISDYLRGTFNAYVRNVLIEENCCVCGSKDDLHLHHDSISHKALCMECIEDIGHTINETCLDLTGRELQNLENIYIGKSFTDVKYKTLCSTCHKKLHEENGYKRSNYGCNGKNLIDRIEYLKVFKNEFDHHQFEKLYDLLWKEFLIEQKEKQLKEQFDKLYKLLWEEDFKNILKDILNKAFVLYDLRPNKGQFLITKSDKTIESRCASKTEFEDLNRFELLNERTKNQITTTILKHNFKNVFSFKEIVEMKKRLIKNFYIVPKRF